MQNLMSRQTLYKYSIIKHFLLNYYILKMKLMKFGFDLLDIYVPEQKKVQNVNVSV